MQHKPLTVKLSIAIVCSLLLGFVLTQSSLAGLFLPPAKTHIVTNTNDSGPGSLREAVALAGEYDTILIRAIGTLTLTSGAIVINQKNLSIIGPGSDQLTISGNNSSRIFEVDPLKNNGVGHHGVTITRILLQHGSGPDGGAIVNYAGLHLVHVIITASSASGKGGAISNEGALLLSDAILVDNSAPNGGGLANNGAASLVRSTIAGNQAQSGDGGGILNEGVAVTLNSTLSGNSATGNGGGMASDGVATINFSTLVENSADGSGGGLYVNSSVAAFGSTIFGQNHAPDGPDIKTDSAPLTVSNGYNLVQDISGISGLLAPFPTDTDVTGQAPGIGPLQDNGGPTPTHALTDDSPAIDKIPADKCYVRVDQRYAARPVGRACDIGAFEFGGEPPTPRPYANLRGSAKYGSQLKLGPDGRLTYTIRLHNSGNHRTTAAVSDPIPPELTYIDGSVTGGGSYDPGTHTVAWTDVTVPITEDVKLTFAVTGTTKTPQWVVNTAIITPFGQDAFRRSFPTLLLPERPVDDVHPPIVHDFSIDNKDVLTSQDVTLHISATDNIDVAKMYIREWQLTTTPVPHWRVVKSSGWIPFQANPAWKLGSHNGTHFVGVWVADRAGNRSRLHRGSLDFASLITPGQTISKNGLIPYLVYYKAGEDVTATLAPAIGDADLYVWYPGNSFLPDQKSTNPGTATDTVNFTTPRDGVYLFVVHGYTAATFDFGITPSGGPGALPFMALPPAAEVSSEAITQAEEKVDELTIESLLSWSGGDPLEITEAPNGPVEVYLPIIQK